MCKTFILHETKVWFHRSNLHNPHTNKRFTTKKATQNKDLPSRHLVQREQSIFLHHSRSWYQHFTRLLWEWNKSFFNTLADFVPLCVCRTVISYLNSNESQSQSTVLSGFSFHSSVRWWLFRTVTEYLHGVCNKAVFAERDNSNFLRRYSCSLASAAVDSQPRNTDKNLFYFWNEHMSRLYSFLDWFVLFIPHAELDWPYDLQNPQLKTFVRLLISICV